MIATLPFDCVPDLTVRYDMTYVLSMSNMR